MLFVFPLGHVYFPPLCYRLITSSTTFHFMQSSFCKLSSSQACEEALKQKKASLTTSSWAGLGSVLHKVSIYLPPPVLVLFFLVLRVIYDLWRPWVDQWLTLSPFKDLVYCKACCQCMDTIFSLVRALCTGIKLSPFLVLSMWWSRQFNGISEGF